MTDDKNPMLTRIRALLAKAESSEFEAEAEQFRAKAAELAARYNIDAAMLAATGIQRETAADVAILRVEFAGSYTMEKMNLFATLGRALGMQMVDNTRRGRAYRSDAYGLLAERQLLEVLYTSLLIQSDRELRRASVPSHLYGAEIVVWKRSWLLGFASRIGARLREQRAASARQHDRASGATGHGAELVLVSREDLVRRAFQDLNPGMPPLKRTVTLDHDGMRAGHAAGGRANLGGDKLDGGVRGLLPSGQ